MAVNPEQIKGLDLRRIPRWALWARLPLQPLAMLWVWRATRVTELFGLPIGDDQAGIALRTSGQEFFEQAAGGAEEALQVAEHRARVLDQFDRLVERDVFDRPAQRAGDQRG